MKQLPDVGETKHTRPRIDEQHALLLAHRADSLGTTQEQYLASLIRADADRVRAPVEQCWTSVLRQLDRLEGSIVLLATVQAELALDVQNLQSGELETLRTVASEVESLLAKATKS